MRRSDTSQCTYVVCITARTLVALHNYIVGRVAFTSSRVSTTGSRLGVLGRTNPFPQKLELLRQHSQGKTPGTAVS